MTFSQSNYTTYVHTNVRKAKQGQNDTVHINNISILDQIQAYYIVLSQGIGTIWKCQISIYSARMCVEHIAFAICFDVNVFSVRIQIKLNLQCASGKMIRTLRYCAFMFLFKFYVREGRKWIFLWVMQSWKVAFAYFSRVEIVPNHLNTNCYSAYWSMQMKLLGS